MKIELVYFKGCPNFSKTKAELATAMEELSIEAKIVMLDREEENIPEHALLYGSPSILINGSDLFGAKPSKYSSCRLYGRKGYPNKMEIMNKLELLGASKQP